MNKRLLAVAVAGALAAPAAAFAQSSVTISGVFKGGFESMKYANSGLSVNSTSGIADDSSRIIFNVVEDLGGGLQAIGQYDFRGTIDIGGLSAAGNDHVGLRSKTWGRIFIGRQDLHYFNRESDLTTRGTLRADSISLLSYVANTGGATQAIANASRTSNVVHYTTPNWGGFTLIAAYSANPNANTNEADLAAVGGIRKGRAWNLNPNFQGSNFQVGYSYWTSKNDGGANSIALGDQRGDRLYGSFNWGGFKVGLAWDKSRIKGATSGTTLARRTTWSIPLSYTFGAHSINFHYDRAGEDNFQPGDNKARMFALSYGYDLSKRTSVAVTYARINNQAGANYNFFTNTSLGVANLAVPLGADPRLWAVTMRHQF